MMGGRYVRKEGWRSGVGGSAGGEGDMGGGRDGDQREGE